MKIGWFRRLQRKRSCGGEVKGVGGGAVISHDVECGRGRVIGHDARSYVTLATMK